MIKTHYGKRLTPKQAARHELLSVFHGLCDFSRAIDREAMTEKEGNEYSHQIDKHYRRIEKILGV